MENDTIRGSGGDTLIDIWVDGKLRAISISKAAIETFLGTEAVSGTTEESRCEFVRTHLSLVVSAAKARLREGDPTMETIQIEAGQLGGVGERRKSDRRKTDRRKAKLNPEKLPHGERRRADRRTTERRKSPKKSAD